MALDKDKIKEELKDFTEDAAEVIGDALKKHFWKSVKSASNAISEANGVSFFKGIGELPFVQQATFSIWESEDDINNFAYSNTSHRNIVTKTKKQKWYKEDLFARFHILSDSGEIKS